MSSTEPIQTPKNTSSHIRLRILMENVRRMRRRENWANVGKFFLVYLGILFIVWLLAVAFRLAEPPEAGMVVLALGIGLFSMAIDFLIKFIVCFWPFLLYFWACAWAVRRRTLLSLIQASIETKTPLAEMIRAYACDCYSSRFRKRLERFANVLEQGHSLGQAIEWDRGLFPYDVVGMLHLGGDDPAALRSMEATAKEERDYSPIRSMSIVRLVYFFSVLAFFLPVVTFILYAIIPKFEAIFVDFDTELPAMTVCVIALSNWFVKYGFLILGQLIPIAVLLAVVFLIIQTNIVVWRPPFLRRVFRETDSSRMLRLLSVGMKHNATIPQILHVYRKVVPSSYLKRQALRMEQSIEKGRGWIEVLKKRRMVNGPEASLLETARRTGNTASVLEQLAVSKERSQLRKDDLTSKLVFIPSMLGLGLIIGFFVIALFLPLVKLITTLSG